MFRIGFVVSEFNKDITEKMDFFASKKAKELGMHIQKKFFVSGVLDSPFAVKKLLEKKDIDGAIVLGAVIKGKTKHDEVVAFTFAQKITDLSLSFNKPVCSGVCGPGITRKEAIKRIKPYSERAVNALKKLLELEEQ